MIITLRKASALVSSIHDVIKSIQLTASVELNEFQEATDVLASARTSLMSAINRRDNLTAAMYDIRKLIGVANFTAGITGLLADVAHVDRRILQATDLATLVAHPPIEVISGRLARISTIPADARRYGQDVVITTAITAEDVTDFAAHLLSLKRRKQHLADVLLDLNVRYEITIPEAIVTLLTHEGLL